MTISAGLLLYRFVGDDSPELLLGHMGGPFWAQKHDHAWSIPKGLVEDGDADLLAVAEREFAEEMGTPAPTGDTLDLGSVKASGKTIRIFSRQADFNAGAALSNTFEMEWPRGSGKLQSFPEIDKAEWVPVGKAQSYLTKGQGPFVERFITAIGNHHK